MKRSVRVFLRLSPFSPCIHNYKHVEDVVVDGFAVPNNIHAAIGAYTHPRRISDDTELSNAGAHPFPSLSLHPSSPSLPLRTMHV